MIQHDHTNARACPSTLKAYNATVLAIDVILSGDTEPKRRWPEAVQGPRERRECRNPSGSPKQTNLGAANITSSHDHVLARAASCMLRYQQLS